MAPVEVAKISVPAEIAKAVAPADATNSVVQSEVSDDVLEILGDAMIAESEKGETDPIEIAGSENASIFSTPAATESSSDFSGEESETPNQGEQVVKMMKAPLEKIEVSEPEVFVNPIRPAEYAKVPDSAKVMVAELAAAITEIDTKTVSVQSVSVVGEDGITSVITETVTEVNEMAVSVEQRTEPVDVSVPTVKVEKPHTPRTFEQVVVEQVSTKLADSVKSGMREVTLILKPEMLGEVKITIQVTGDVVSAKLQVENQQVKNIVENNLQNLRDSLAQHNLSAGALDVNVGNGESRNAEAKNGSRRRKSAIADSIEAFENDPFVPDLFGKETGRRYGNNSVEYYA